ncbi:MAG: oligosaccharide flippase family protein [Halobacteriota archaeon]
MSDYELLVKRIGLTGLANLIVWLSPIILLPILTKILSIQEYGVWALIIVTASLVPMLVTLGLQNSMIRFLASATNTVDIREGYYSIALVVFGAGLAMSLLLLAFGYSIAAGLLNNNRTVALLLPLITLVASYIVVPQAYFRTFQQAKRYSITTSLQTFLYVTLVAAFVVGGLGLTGAAIGYLIALLLAAAVSTQYVLKDIGATFPRFVQLRAYLRYGLPLVPGMISTWALNASDRYIITFFLGVAWVGYYSPGYQLGNVISLLAMPFVILVPTAVFAHYDANRIAEVKTIMRYSVKYFLAVAMPAAFLFSVLSRPLLMALTSPAIASNGYLITPFAAFSSVLYGLFSIIGIVFTFEKRTAALGTIWILAAALNVGCNLILVPYLGIMGAALTTLVGYSFVCGVGTLYATRLMRFDVDFGFILKSIFASGVVSSFVLVWHPTGFLGVCAFILTCAAVYTAILFVLKGFAVSEVRFFRGLLTKGS